MTATAVVTSIGDWTRKLHTRNNGTRFGDERNIMIAFNNSPDLKGLLAYNEFRDKVIMSGDLPDIPEGPTERPTSEDWSDDHLTWLVAWMQNLIPVRRDTVQSVVIAVAKSHSFHPVRDYLKELKWDGLDRLTTWLKIYLGARDPAAYLEAVGPKMLIGAVARIMEPGCKMDNILVLEGNQGLGKSSAVESLGGREWVRDITGDLSNKDAAVNIQGVWIGEMGELAAVKRSEQEVIKGFLSRKIDHYRPPYGRNSVDRPRHCIFIGTTNDCEYLQDPTGARRIWPVECTKIDIPGIERDRHQLWAEAMHRYRVGERWHLNPIEAYRASTEQEARQRVSPIDTTILEYLDNLVDSGIRKIEMRAILAECFSVSAKEDPHKAAGLAGQVGRNAVRAGWKKMRATGRGRNRKQEYQYEPPQPPPEEPCEHYEHCEPAADSSSQGSQGSQGPDEDIPF